MADVNSSISDYNTRPFFNSSTVWEANEDNVETHFVYGLTVAGNGDILAFCEGRVDVADSGAHHLFMKRSKDNGVTWGSTQYIVTSDGIKCFNNPVPIVEKSSQKIFLFYAINNRNESSVICYITSNDNGYTWSQPTDITHILSSGAKTYPFHLPGPGHGIQQSGGRLLLQIWHRKGISCPGEQREYNVSVIYSDDGGESWHLGGEISDDEMATNESRIFEVSDGSVLINARSFGDNSTRRAVSTSTDGGLTWTELEFQNSFPEHFECDDGFIQYDNNIILCSFPDDEVARKNLTVIMSEDGGLTWPIKKRITTDPSFYSDLAVTADKTVICLYGKGGEHKYFPGFVECASFNMEWLLEKE